jgi:signal transduction histidine kinase
MRSRAFVITTCVFLTLVVAGAGYCLERRHAGSRELDDVRRELGIASAADALDQLIASAPSLDPARQGRLWGWMREEPNRQTGHSAGQDESWFLRGEAQAPEAVTEWMRARAPRMEALRSILAEGPVCTTTLGALAITREHLLTAESHERRVPIPNLIAMREAYRWFGLEAMTVPDPTTALDALDALDRSQQHAGTLIDAMIASACAAMRDRTYLRLVLRDRAPATHLRAWLAEVPDARAQMARAMRGERLLHWAYLADLLERSSLPRGGDDVADTIDWWLNGDRKIARMGRHNLVAEEVLAGSRPVAALDEFVGDETNQWLFGINVPAMMITIVSTDTGHRMARSAASLVVAQQRSGVLPGGNDEALSSVLPFRALSSGDTYAPVLRYERVEDGRFRILADTQQGLAPDVREDLAMYIANPPRTLDDRHAGPQVAISMWSIELRVR